MCRELKQILSSIRYRRIAERLGLIDLPSSAPNGQMHCPPTGAMQDKARSSWPGAPKELPADRKTCEATSGDN